MSRKYIWWHVAAVFLDQPRLGLKSIVVVSLHLNNKYAKRPVAGPRQFAKAFDDAQAVCERLGCPS
eukprot:9003546-Lingulodinium_polyedra.AAC.1